MPKSLIIMGKAYFGLLLIFSISLQSQENYPKDAFSPPLDIPLVLAGNFGELRSNHFHAGIDIKTQQRQGLPVHSIADGTVVRIKVAHWGYGKVIYVAHPNGFTSVYGHLSKFSPTIEKYIKDLQYKKKSYEVEAFPDYGELKVQKGELIAYSGDTGSSGGPHVHFEVRSTITEKPINPLLFGFDVRDATDPTVLELFGYPLSDDAEINQSNDRTKILFRKQGDGSYLADPVHAIGTIGFGINAYDRQDLAANKNGVYSVHQLVNAKLYTDYDFETFSFTEGRYINTLIDYEYYINHQDRIQKCFRVAGNQLSIYRTLVNDGKIVVNEGLSYNVEIQIRDLEDNLTKLVIPVEGKREELKVRKNIEKTDNYVIAKKPNNFDLGIAKVYFPANTFYDDFYIDLKKGSDTVMIHNNTVPCHRNFTITFDASKYSQEEQKQLFIARLDKYRKPNYITTYKRGSNFTTRTRDLGTYTLAKDTIAPKISANNFKEKQWLNNYHYLSLRITDDLSGIDTYNATLNGEWILMEYEPKTNTLTYNFDDRILDKKECNLEVVVTDNVGNTSTFTRTFFRK